MNLTRFNKNKIKTLKKNLFSDCIEKADHYDSSGQLTNKLNQFILRAWFVTTGTSLCIVVKHIKYY